MDKRHFTVVIGSKEHGLYVSSKPSSAAKKAVSKLCASNKSKKVEFSLREITQGSKKKTYGPYIGEMKKLKKPIELKGRVIRHEIKLHLKKEKRSTIKTAKKMRGGYISDSDFDNLAIKQFKTPLAERFTIVTHGQNGNSTKPIDDLIRKQLISEFNLEYGEHEKAYIFFNPIKDHSSNNNIYYEYLAYIKKGVLPFLPFLTKLRFKKLEMENLRINETDITNVPVDFLSKLKIFIENLDESSPYKSDYLKYLNDSLRKHNISI
jgi:hypothetical protein